MKQTRTLRMLAFAALVVAASPGRIVAPGAAALPGAIDSPAAVSAAAGGITAGGLVPRIRRLASDRFEGREPATPGEVKTVAYLTREFTRLGLEAPFDGSYLQEVPLVRITPDFDMRMILGGEKLAFGEDFVAWTKRVTERASLERSQLVFAGYGIVAPEYGRDDFAGVDVRGRTAVVLINDPGFATGDPALFDGRAMTYYGRWSYKYEEAARQGAAGLIIVHETAPAAYGWDVVRNSWSRPQFDLVRPDGNAGRAAVEGWITRDAAARLFSRAGFTLEALKRRALAADFEPVPLDQTVSVTVDNDIGYATSHNVAGLLRGRERPGEHVVYVAHWDHFGRDRSLEGDQIYNGAADNASGVASLLEIARAFTSLAQPPRRSVLFLAVTAEEQGLLGSYHYAAHPLVPTREIAGVFAMDIMRRGPHAREATIIGADRSGLGAFARRAADAQARSVRPHPSPQSGYFYRSDHFAFAKAGVPGLLFLNPGAPDSAYVRKHYHQPSDEYSADWDLTGMVEDARLFFRAGHALAASERFPSWREGSEFHSRRERDRSGGVR